MIEMSDGDRVELRRWAIEHAISAGFGRYEPPSNLVTAAEAIEAYVLKDLVSSPDDKAPP